MQYIKFGVVLLIFVLLGCGLPEPTPTEKIKYTERNIPGPKATKVSNELLASLAKAKQANAYWNRAAESWSSGEIEQAAESMKNYIEIDPNNAEAHNVIGLDHYYRKRYDLALKEFQIASKLNPEEKQYSFNEALALVILGRYEEADQAFERSSGLEEGEFMRRLYMELIPQKRAKEMYNEGVSAMGKPDVNTAIERFKSALIFDPNMVNALVNLGICYGMKGDSAQQIYHLEEALKLKQNDPNIYYNLGLAYYDSENYAKAIEEFRRVISLKPSFQDAHFKIGMSLCNISNFEAAIPAFKKSVELNPYWYEARINLGTCYLKTENPEGALSQFQDAVRLRPSLAEPHYSLGIAYMRLKRYDEAEASLTKALDIDPGHKLSQAMMIEIKNYKGE